MLHVACQTESHLHTACLKMCGDMKMHAYDSGLIHNHDLTREETINIGGKFAVIFTILDVDCDQSKDFASAAKQMSTLIDHAIVNCGGKPTVL
ncbi:hypothetical protein TELCIR_10622 [Teladorsagia circumcincta]|uniref:Uncharacterized protein n=1 Tax=Teladorsagia circumcincta TaxID=45464 RepID=A0A2G9UBL4_TELCI|nr:hypothetical protein TELCIR_10622 [Teladorsagia circumcincta]